MKKKLMTTLALTGLIGGVACATNVVSSANIVGYVKTPTPEAGSFNIISLVQFSDGSDTVNIQDAIGNMDSLNASDTWDNADKLYIWTGLNYSKFGLFQPTSGSSYWATYGTEWIFGTCIASEEELSRGNAVWYATGTGGTSTNVVVSGDVYVDDTFDIAVSEGFNILSYPYSSNINLTNMVVSNATASTTWENADKIFVFNGSNYEKFGLFAGATGDFWALYGTEWIFGTCTPASKTLNLGQGFWFESDSAKTISYSKIYNVD